MQLCYQCVKFIEDSDALLMSATPHSLLTDVELWLLLREGDSVALSILHERHYKVLYRYGFKIAKDKEVVLDSLQELFFQLWVRREALHEVKAIRYYLMKWLKRELVRAQIGPKARHAFIGLDDEDSLLIAVEMEDLLEKAEWKSERSQILQAALEGLSPREREVIYMRFFLELSYTEICDILQLSYQVVMNYVHRGLKTLRADSRIGRIATSVIVVAATTKIFALLWLVGGM